MTTEVQNYNDKLHAMSTANFAARAVSYIIDILVIWGVSQIAVYPFLNALNLNVDYIFLPYFSIERIVTAVLMVLYFVLMTYFLNQTLGKMVTGIKVKPDKGEKLTISQVLYREVIGRFINNTLFYLPYLVVLFTEKRIGIHDYFADTHVVSEKFESYANEIHRGLIPHESSELHHLKNSGESSTTDI